VAFFAAVFFAAVFFAAVFFVVTFFVVAFFVVAFFAVTVHSPLRGSPPCLADDYNLQGTLRARGSSKARSALRARR
jgi:hypothetical protein